MTRGAVGILLHPNSCDHLRRVRPHGIMIMGKKRPRSLKISCFPLHSDVSKLIRKALELKKKKVAPCRVPRPEWVRPFEFVTSEAGDTRSASDYLSAQLVGITRVLEAALSLNPELRWVFLKPPVSDVWSDASEAYFRVLVEGLRTATPSARFDFLSMEQI